jgi:hypothetical protein
MNRHSSRHGWPSPVTEGDMKLLHFYEWLNDGFYFDLRTDPGEQSNMASSPPVQSQVQHRKTMDHLKSAGGYLPSPTQTPSGRSHRKHSAPPGSSKHLFTLSSFLNS